ncbi:hypothetical protein [Streptomyces sp. NPDC002403]
MRCAPRPAAGRFQTFGVVRRKVPRQRLVERSGNTALRRPDRRIVDETTEVRHLHLLRPVPQDQRLIRRELMKISTVSCC